MGLRWTTGDASRDGFDDRGMLTANVVRYTDSFGPDGKLGGGETFWAAFIALYRIDDVRYPSAEAAMEAVDERLLQIAIADLDASVAE